MISPLEGELFAPARVTEPASPALLDRQELRRNLSRLRERNIHVGTSSWKYEGWLDMLYTPARYATRGRFSKARFEQECLGEFAETFSSVCVDAGFYRFPAPDMVARLGDQVPEGFRFSFKVTDEITVKHFPNHARHGEKAGRANPNFLNTDLFATEFLRPLSGLGSKLGLIILEFSRLYERDFARGRDFVEALDHFLGELPGGYQYGVEIRNATFLHPQYFATLRKHGVAHIFNEWTHMPPVAEQMQMEGSFPADYFGARFLLKPGRAYADAVKAFAPYKQTGEVSSSARGAAKSLISRHTAKPSYLFINNRLEGNALLTIASLFAKDKAEE